MPIRLNVVFCFYMRCRFSRAYLVGRAACTRDSLLAAAAACRLRACALPTRTQTRAISTPWGHGRRRRWRVPGRAAWAVWAGAKSTREQADSEEKVMGLNCLVEGASEVTHHTSPWLAFFAFFLSPLARALCILLSLALTCSAMRNACLACSLIAHQNITSCRGRPPGPQTTQQQTSANLFLSVASGVHML